MFETTTMLAYLAMRLTVTAGVCLIDMHMPVMMNVTS